MKEVVGWTKWNLSLEVLRIIDAGHRDEIMIPNSADYFKFMMLVRYVR